MENQNELNDIILNKGGATSSNKKIILSVATLGVILVIVVMLMNSLSSNGTDNLPQAALPPEPNMKSIVKETEEPLFEDIKVLEEEVPDDNNLNEIATKLKQESREEEIEIITPVAETPKPKPVVKKSVVAEKKPEVKSQAKTPKYYIQVGSFSKYAPNKKFLQSIKNLGYGYIYHEVMSNSKRLNKVLVGPFNTSYQAKQARVKIRAKIEPGAFLIKL